MAVTASTVAHLVVLAVAFAQHPTIAIPDTPEAPAPDAITVQLVRITPSAASGQAAPPHLHRSPPIVSPAGSPIPPLPAAAPSPPGPVAAPGAAQGPDLRLGLRHGLAGCANMAVMRMGRAERDLCNERLGRGMAKEEFLAAALDGRIRAYYDQVALAKAPDPPPVPLVAIGHLGILQGDPRTTNGHGPSIGCKVYFGVGKRPPKLPHALYLGPCFIEPPKGSLTPEVDITPP